MIYSKVSLLFETDSSFQYAWILWIFPSQSFWLCSFGLCPLDVLPGIPFIQDWIKLFFT